MSPFLELKVSPFWTDIKVNGILDGHARGVVAAVVVVVVLLVVVVDDRVEVADDIDDDVVSLDVLEDVVAGLEVADEDVADREDVVVVTTAFFV